MMDTYAFRGMVIPSHMMAAIRRYIDHRIAPGGFLTAVITNNLRSTVEAADDTNLELIPAYVAYFYNKAPATCWGSVERYQQWLYPPEDVVNHDAEE